MPLFVSLILIANETKILTCFGYVEYYGLLQVVKHLDTHWTRLQNGE